MASGLHRGGRPQATHPLARALALKDTAGDYSHEDKPAMLPIWPRPDSPYLPQPKQSAARVRAAAQADEARKFLGLPPRSHGASGTFSHGMPAAPAPPFLSPKGRNMQIPTSGVPAVPAMLSRGDGKRGLLPPPSGRPTADLGVEEDLEDLLAEASRIRTAMDE